MFNFKLFTKNKNKNLKYLEYDEKIRRKEKNNLIYLEKYSYAHLWTWLGQPIIQLPEDILITQELIYKCKPSVIIETGVAWGGSVLFYSSILSMIGGGKIIAVDNALTSNIRSKIMRSNFSDQITLINGDSTSPNVINKISKMITSKDRVMVFLDSNHEANHVLDELKKYSKFVTKNQYLNVYATAIEYLPKSIINKRSWGPGASPATAINKFLELDKTFKIDNTLDIKALKSFIPGGRLRKYK